MKSGLAAMVIAAAVVYVYLPLLGADFVYWDDHALFTHDLAIQAFDVARFFTDLSIGGFFPLTRVSLALDHALFGYVPALSHAVNVGLHLVNVWLVHLVARRTFGLEARDAGLVASAFALHPMNVEVVAWVSGGRKDLLCTMFYMATLASLGHAHAAVTAGFGLLAHLAKASAVTLTPWLAFARSRLAFVLLPVSLTVAVLEILAQRTVLHVSSDPSSPAQVIGRALTALTLSVSRYLWPRNLAVFYDRALVRVDWLDAALVLTLVGFGVHTYRRRGWAGLRGAAFFLLALAPTLKLLPFGQDSAFNDRYLYGPSVGLLSLFGGNVAGRWRALWAVPLVAFGILARAQTSAWRSQEALWLNVIAKYPASRKAAGNLTLWYAEQGRIDLAEPWAKRSVDEAPLDLGARSNYGVVLTRLGKLEAARDLFLETLRLAPGDAQLLNNLGYVYLDLGDKARARDVFTRALEVSPDFANARAGLARTKE